MKHLELIAYMAFMTNAVAATVSKFGKHSATPLTVFPVLPLLTIRLFACMEV